MIKETFDIENKKNENYLMTTHDVIKQLYTKIIQMARINSASSIITNYKLSPILQDSSHFEFWDIPNLTTEKTTEGFYKVGSFYGIDILVDPNMKCDDTRIIFQSDSFKNIDEFECELLVIDKNETLI